MKPKKHQVTLSSTAIMSYLSWLRRWSITCSSPTAIDLLIVKATYTSICDPLLTEDFMGLDVGSDLAIHG